MINGGQNVKVEKGFIEFKNFNKTIPARIKIYVYFECLLKNVDCGINNDCFSYSSKYQDHVPCSFSSKLDCVNDKNCKDLVFYRGTKMQFLNLFSLFLKNMIIASLLRKIILIKNFVMSCEKNEEFEKSNICWICGKLIEIDDNKVRDHCHITGNYRGSCHWSCNINLKVSKKLVVIFHTLKRYDSHLIFKETSKFNCSVSIIPNELEKYMSFKLSMLEKKIYVVYE